MAEAKIIKRRKGPGDEESEEVTAQNLRTVEKKTPLREPKMARTGYPCENNIIESFLNPLKHENVNSVEDETFGDFIARLPYSYKIPRQAPLPYLSNIYGRSSFPVQYRTSCLVKHGPQS